MTEHTKSLLRAFYELSQTHRGKGTPTHSTPGEAKPGHSRLLGLQWSTAQFSGGVYQFTIGEQPKSSRGVIQWCGLGLLGSRSAPFRGEAQHPSILTSPL